MNRNSSFDETPTAAPDVLPPPEAPPGETPPPQVEALPQQVNGNGHGKAEVFEVLDPAEVVQEAEQMLREAAPHDYDVLVIGAGPGGYVAALRAAQLGKKVAVVEDREIGGVCLNRGCIPTKTLLESVDVMRIIRRAAEYGIEIGDEAPRVNFAKMHARKREVVKTLCENVAQLLRESGVEFLAGRASFTGARRVEITPLETETGDDASTRNVEKNDDAARADQTRDNAKAAEENAAASTRSGDESGDAEIAAAASTRSGAKRDDAAREYSHGENAPGEKRVVTAASVIIAVGSLPSKLPVEGADLLGVLTTDDVLQGDESVPESLAVVGGGAVGVEFAYLYQQMGARVVVIETSPQVLPQEDENIGAEMQRILENLGLELRLNSRLTRLEKNGDELDVFFQSESEDAEQKITVARVLMASGRKPNTENLNLEAAGVKHAKGRIEVDEMCRTNVEGVYAIGDCVRDAGWAHLASGEGKMVAEQIAGGVSEVDLEHVPSCYYTHPEIASVGLTQKEAEGRGLKTRRGTFYFRASGRAAAAGDHDGFVQVVIEDESEKLLGCQIIGPRATDLISEAVLALKTGQTVAKMVGAIHAHPTFSEALPEAALNARKV